MNDSKKQKVQIGCTRRTKLVWHFLFHIYGYKCESFNLERSMKFFLDTAEISVISDLYSSGLIDGVTTNPSLIAKSGRNILEVI